MRCFEQINFKNKNIEDNIQQGRKYRYTRVAHFITLDWTFNQKKTTFKIFLHPARLIHFT